MININSGAIVFEDHLRVDSQTQFSKMEDMPCAKVFASVAGRTQLSIGAHTVEGKCWGVGVVFVQAKLSQIWLQCLNADGVDVTAWSLENEKIRKATHDIVVKKQCSSTGSVVETTSTLVYKFPWGKVSSILDIRGVQALILVEYF